MKRARNKMARNSRKINRGPSKRAPWFWTFTVPNKRGWWAHAINDAPAPPPCVRRIRDLGYVRERYDMCVAVDLEPIDRWSNRRLHRDERGDELK